MMAVTPFNPPEKVIVEVRAFNPATDWSSAVAMEEKCESGPPGQLSLFTHLSDPIARVRHTPSYLMLVAETCGQQKEIVGLVRGCIKTVTCGIDVHRSTPLYTKLAYILGLRVSPSHRRMNIGLKLVQKMEEWFRAMGAEYAYMATESSNEASVGLFTGRCGYSKFRTPSILVQPVFSHRLPTSRSTTILRLSSDNAQLIYRNRLANVEFFPTDIGNIVNNKLSLGTFLAFPSEYNYFGMEEFLAAPPPSWSILSIWNCKEVYQLEIRGATSLRRGLAAATRVVDKALPWLRLPSVPDLFQPFGYYFLYGIGGEGDEANVLLKSLCKHAHNLAVEGGCAVVATEVAGSDPLKAGIPHWKRLSCEDLWCMKKLGYGDGDGRDWTTAPQGNSIFVDPREL